MGAQGTATVDFGSFPGKTDVTAVVTGQAAILGTSLVEAWIMPVATADHSADEHWVDSPRIMAGNIVAGTGFTIYASMEAKDVGVQPQTSNGFYNEDITPMIYGQWTVAWVWN